MMPKMLEIRNLSKTFGGGRTLFGAQKPSVHAVRGVSLSVEMGETLGIVGESGCGKSTFARMLVGLLPSSAGDIVIDGQSIHELQKDRKELSRTIQYIFQDSISSLNPRKTIRETLEAPMRYLHGMNSSECGEFLHELLAAVNLRPEFLSRYPHEFSGGQAQRIGIARALAAKPKILLLDEPVSALDVSVQAQVLNLLEDLKARYNLTYIFISHDLGVVEAVADNVAVLYFGSVVETGSAQEIFKNSKHPYTELLAGSAPVVGKNFQQLEAGDAELPDPLNPPKGCAFAKRCNYVKDRCHIEMPKLIASEAEHGAACHYPR